MEKNAAQLLVPSYILEHFDFEGYEISDKMVKVYVVEKDDLEHIPSAVVREGKVVLDGYMNTIELQTFPALGREVFLYLKRRRWKLKGQNKGYHNSYHFHTPGMKATKEFGAFLKEIGRG